MMHLGGRLQFESRIIAAYGSDLQRKVRLGLSQLDGLVESAQRIHQPMPQRIPARPRTPFCHLAHLFLTLPSSQCYLLQQYLSNVQQDMNVLRNKTHTICDHPWHEPLHDNTSYLNKTMFMQCAKSALQCSLLWMTRQEVLDSLSIRTKCQHLLHKATIDVVHQMVDLF